MADVLNISVRSRKKVLFEDVAYSITSFNNLGEFDILPQHANMVTLLRDRVIIDKGGATEQEIKFDTALMSVIKNEVLVYLDI